MERERIEETAGLLLPETDIDIDPGIKRAVGVLWSNGVETISSCEGGPGHSFPEPTIWFNGDAGEGFRAVGLAISNGLQPTALRRTWHVCDKALDGPIWELVFFLGCLQDREAE